MEMNMIFLKRKPASFFENMNGSVWSVMKILKRVSHDTTRTE